MQKDNKKVTRAWAFYDWANSAYNLVITSTIFPAYYTVVTSDKDSSTQDYVNFFGYSFINSALYSYALAFAFLVIAFISPILSSIADSRGNKKTFMKIFTYIGSAACCGLFFFKGQNIELGIICMILAAIGFWGSLVFYNAYLPEIASVEEQDKVSAKGFAYGYIGSIILQILCFVFVFKPDWFGIVEPSMPFRISFLMVGVWWIVFAQIPFKVLPKSAVKIGAKKGNVFTDGFKELRKVWRIVKEMRYLKLFLGAFFFYAMAVQTVMLIATIFGEKELELSTEKLIGTILLLQLLAIPGAILMSYLSSKKYGNIPVLIGVVFIWVLVCISAYYLESEIEFYILAGVIGLIMGGIQSLSRSTYSKIIPQNHNDQTSFFSFYDVTEKVALVIGMFSFAYIEEISGSMRNSVLVLAVFFVIGLIFLIFVNKIAPSVLKVQNEEA